MNPSMRTVEVELPPLYPLQREIERDASRFKVLACGRRWGKTRLGVVMCLTVGLMGGVAWWVAPAYKTARIGWRLLHRLAAQIPGAKVHKTELVIELPGGGRIQVRSADDPDSLRGEGLDFLAMDECAFTLEAAWTEALRPALSDRRGNAMFISSPKGRDWFWRLWCRGAYEHRESWKSWQLPSISNPYLDPAEIEEARLDLPSDKFAQEYGAEFLEGSGGVFKGVYEAIDEGRSAAEPARPGCRYILGVDLARKNDFTALPVLEADTGRQVYFERFTGVGWNRQIDKILEVWETYNRADVWMDCTGVGDPIAERVEERGVDVNRVVFTNRLKREMIEGLAVAIERRDVALMDVPPQTAELLAYEYVTSRFGTVQMGAPSGMNDDTVTGLALARYGQFARRDVEFS